MDARGLTDTVHLTGYRADLPQVLAASDVCVLSSYREGTLRVITEAMASGLSVVATDIAGIPEQVTPRESGYLVEPGDVDGLATSLERLVADPTFRERFGDATRTRVEAFSDEQMLTDLDSVYRDCLRTENDGAKVKQRFPGGLSRTMWLPMRQ